MLGISALEKIVGQEKETNAVEILQKLDSDITDKLADDNKYQLNGMDISILVLDEKLNTAEFAGAMGEISLINSGGEITNYKPNLASIASGRLKNIKSETISINKGDSIFMYSDGYQDQFKGGSEKIETYNFERFQNLLSQISKKKNADAIPFLDNDLNSWKKDKEQIDDIMIIGLKF